MTKHNPIKRNKKRLILLGVLVLLASLTAWLLIPNSSRDRFLNESAEEATDNAQTTSTTPTAQSDYTSGNDRPVSNQDKNEGLVVDNHGNVGNVPSEDQWTSSNSGQITVYFPAQNALLADGDSLSGSSSLSEISFRLIDSVSGLIAQGQITVVNGKFSGTFDFNTSANEGRLDVFGVASDGTEFSEIEIPVRFR